MTDDTFWRLVAESNSESCAQQADSLTQLLEGLPADQIIAFNNRWHEFMAQAYRWDLWGVAYIVNGGCSDDGFHYFRSWLIGQGKSHYEAALTDATLAVDKVAPGDIVECEDLNYAALEAYQRVTGDNLPAPTVAHPLEPSGEPWSEDDLQERYPSLAKRFWQ